MKKDVYTISLYHNITISSFFCCFFNVSTIVMVMVMFMATFWSILIMGHHWCGEWRWETEATCVRLLRGCSPLLLSSICGATHILLASIFFVVWLLFFCIWFLDIKRLYKFSSVFISQLIRSSRLLCFLFAWWKAIFIIQQSWVCHH